MSDRAAIQHALANADLFYDMDHLLLELLASICEEKTYQRNEVIFEENSDESDLYIIAEGEVEIKVRPGVLGSVSDDTLLPLKTIAVLRQGQNFGEVAMVDDGRRTASAVCSENGTRLLVFSGKRLLMMCENVPKLGYRLMRNIAADMAMKIRHTDLAVREQLTWVPRNQEE